MVEQARKSPSGLPKAYLFIYNTAQCAGWTYILIISCLHFFQNGFTPKGLYSTAEIPLKIFQTAAVLEVVHCAVGLVPSPVAITAMQVASRVGLLWPITHSVKEVQDNTSVLMFLLAWTVTEIIRYSLYACNLVQYKPYILQWLRYTLFIVLYPIGVTGELLTIYSALPYVKERQIYSVTMPNALNISFNFYYALIIAMVSYLPGFPNLYIYMIYQRKKVLGKKREAPEKTD